MVESKFDGLLSLLYRLGSRSSCYPVKSFGELKLLAASVFVRLAWRYGAPGKAGIVLRVLPKELALGKSPMLKV